ncbi:MAG: response regulator transcription factor [Pseudomonadota bacterium]
MTASQRKRRRVLIVEDDSDLQLLLQNILKGEYEVLIADNGLEALKTLESEDHPDLIIADIMMPILDGLTMVDAIKKHRATSDIPVIFLTAKSTPKDVIDGISVGAKYYVTKPFKIDDLLSKIKKILK